MVNQHESNVSRVIRGRLELCEEDKKAWADALGEELVNLFDSRAPTQVGSGSPPGEPSRPGGRT